MRLLLDTMVIIHLVQAPTAVPVSTRAVLENPANDLFISLVSPWEMQIKADLGKLALGIPVAQAIVEEMTIVSGDQRIRQYPVQCLWD